jgi:pimeloyl-ACP methyl ester carboxylesterase
VQRNVSSSTRICSFDRAGEGWSGAGPTGQNGRQLAPDLHGLLHAARVPGPYVLAGHSVGGIYALLYADRYPSDVAGVALIDSATPHQFELPDYPRFYNTVGRRLYSVMPVVAHASLGQLIASTQFAGLPGVARNQARAFASSSRELAADRADFAELPAVFEEAQSLKSLNGKPLAILTAGAGAQRGWLAAQERLAQLSSNSTQQTVAGATHSALLEDRGFASITSQVIIGIARLTTPGKGQS